MKFCRQEQTTCSNSSQVGYDKVSCKEQTVCYHCKVAHSADSM